MPSIVVCGDGTVKTLTPNSTTTALATTPVQARNSNYLGKKPSFFQYRGNIFCVGPWNRGVMLDFYSQQCYTMGLYEPSAAATIASGAAGSISVDSTVGYYSYVQKIGNTTVDESALSPVSNTLSSLSSVQIDWTGLPSAVPPRDRKVTHVRLYRADDGDAPRKVADVAIGTTTYTDTTPTLSLGAYAELDDIGAPPDDIVYSATYAERAWYVTSEYPDRVYYSRIGWPQSVGSDSYIATREGEAVRGIKKLRDQLLVGCKDCFYSVQLIPGTSGSFVVEKINPSVGLLSHWSMVNIYDRIWFASRDGVFIYDGSFRNVSDDIWHLWRQEYQATTESFHEMEAEHDSYRKIYKLKYLKETSSSIQSRYFCASYADFEPTVAGQGQPQPAWTMDFRGRRDTAMGLLSFGSGPVKLYAGSSDSIIREENVEADADDDGDSYGKALFLQAGVDWPAMLDTDPEGGRTIQALRLYVESESVGWTVNIIGGDEGVVGAFNAVTEVDNTLGWWKFAVPASAKTYIEPTYGATRYSYTATAKTHHHFVPERVSGRGLNLIVTVTNPTGFKFRGWGATTVPGPASRPWVSKETTVSSTSSS